MSTPCFNCKTLYQHARLPAKVKLIQTAHGSFETPAFMPVATKAAINTLSVPELRQTGAEIILGGNTYHMLLAPGLTTIEALGGMHKMMDWSGPMLTDSGGFQVFSLAQGNHGSKINEQGVKFKHPIHGQIISLSPEESIQTQKIIGADIIMAFDQCTPDNAEYGAVEAAMQRTHRWLLRSIAEHQRNQDSAYGLPQALFGIVQGGSIQTLRMESAEFVIQQDLAGIAIGGESIGFNMPKTIEILAWLQDLLPIDKPIYTMGVGSHPKDLLQVVASGADIFDCVAPTRNARHGSLYTGQFKRKDDWLVYDGVDPSGRINISKRIYAEDNQPIEQSCECYTCLNYSRGYLHYLVKNKILLYNSLACTHNLHMMNTVCQQMRSCIKQHSC